MWSYGSTEANRHSSAVRLCDATDMLGPAGQASHCSDGKQALTLEMSGTYTPAKLSPEMKKSLPCRGFQCG